MSSANPEVLISDFPEIIPQTARGNTPDFIARVLRRILKNYGAESGQIVILPSLMLMAQYFQVTHMVVHDAFQLLRRQGYDYHLKGMDLAVAFWYTSACEEDCGR